MNKSSMNAIFDLDRWSASLLFSQSSGVKAGGSGGQIGEHSPRHWVQCRICSARFEGSAEIAEVDSTSGRQGEHEVA